MLSNAQVKAAWGNRCSGSKSRVALNGAGAVIVASAAVPAVKALDACLVAHGYRTRAADTGGYNCRRIAGSSSWSIHAYGLAIDINWQTNPQRRPLKTDMPRAMVNDIERIRTRNGKQVWRWGGHFRTPDAMHFEVCCSPADLATGINPVSLPGSGVTHPSTPTTPISEDDEMAYYRINENGAIFSVAGEQIRHIGPNAWAARQWIAAVGGKPIQLQHISAADFMNFVAATALITLPASA